MKAGPSEDLEHLQHVSKKPASSLRRKLVGMATGASLFYLLLYILGWRPTPHMDWLFRGDSQDGPKSNSTEGDEYLLGVGKADITG